MPLRTANRTHATPRGARASGQHTSICDPRASTPQRLLNIRPYPRSAMSFAVRVMVARIAVAPAVEHVAEGCKGLAMVPVIYERQPWAG